MAIWDTLKSAIVGVGVGEATADAMTPILTPAAQDAWAKNPYKALAASVAAELVAQGITDLATATDEAGLTGINQNRLQAMVQAALVAPGVPEGLTMWRRGSITQDDFTHILRKSMLEPQWDQALGELRIDRLSPQVMAIAIVRGLVDAQGLLPVGPPSAVGNVDAFPVYDIDAVAEAMAAGIDHDRLGILVGINGRPASPQEAAQGVYRGILQQADYQRAISEGDVRNEWAASLFDIFRQIPTAHDGVELRLRGWTDDAGMYAQTARHGMSQEDTDLLFQITGRPISAHQVFIGLLRGGEYNGSTDAIDPAYLKALQESNIRPEWYNLLWAGRYTYPSAFVVRALAQSGELTFAQTLQILTYEGWEPTLANSVAANWTGTQAAPTNKHVTSSTTSLVTAARKAYIGGAATQAETATALDAAGVDAATQTQLFKLWDANRALETLAGPTT